MKSIFFQLKRNTILGALVICSTYAYSQQNIVPPGTLPVGPTDYGKDASSQLVKKHIISFGFFSPLNHHISFGYDQLIGTDAVFTSQIGIIGPGVNNNNTMYDPKPAGAFVELGTKLFFAPDFVTVGTLRYNSMQGGYFKPQLIISVFNLTEYNYQYPAYGGGNYTSTTVTHTGIALMLNFGKQWILAHSLSLDMYAGIGYNINTSNNNADYVDNYYSYEGGGSTPLAFDAGLNIGVPF